MAVQNPPGIEKMVNYPQFPTVEEERHYRKKMLQPPTVSSENWAFLRELQDILPAAT